MSDEKPKVVVSPLRRNRLRLLRPSGGVVESLCWLANISCKASVRYTVAIDAISKNDFIYGYPAPKLAEKT